MTKAGVTAADIGLHAVRAGGNFAMNAAQIVIAYGSHKVIAGEIVAGNSAI